LSVETECGYRLGVDIGGTFTDLVVIGADGSIVSHKVLSTPDDYRRREYRITDVVDTHLHADHISGNRALAQATGAKVWLHEAADVRFPISPVVDGQILHLGQLLIEVVHTPGHRPESICLLVTNPPRSPMPSIILSGDTLFVGDVVRPDFGGPQGARAQHESIRRLLSYESIRRLQTTAEGDPVEVVHIPCGGSCAGGSPAASGGCRA